MQVHLPETDAASLLRLEQELEHPLALFTLPFSWPSGTSASLNLGLPYLKLEPLLRQAAFSLERPDSTTKLKLCKFVEFISYL